MRKMYLVVLTGLLISSWGASGFRFISIVSMQRSSSTHLCYGLEKFGVKCLNELFRNSTIQSGDIWETQGRETGVYNMPSVKGIPPEKLGDLMDR